MLDFRNVNKIDVLKWIEENDIFDKKFNQVVKILGDSVDVDGDQWIHTGIFSWGDTAFTADFEFAIKILELIRLTPIYSQFYAENEDLKKEADKTEKHLKEFFESIGMKPYDEEKLIWFTDDYIFKILPFINGEAGFVIEITLRPDSKVEQRIRARRK